MLQNKMAFTESRIAKLPFAEKGKGYIVRDSNKNNFVVRVGAQTKTYYLIKKVNGKTLYVRLCDAGNTSLVEAYKLFAEQMALVNRGKNPNVEKNKVANTITIGDFFNNYYFPNHSNVHKRKSSQREDKCYFRLHLAPIHPYRMVDIDRALVIKLQRKIYDKAGLYAANHSIKLLRQMYNKAIDWGLEMINPAARIRLYKEIKRDRFLQADELPQFFDALAIEPDVQFRYFVYLSLFLGQRRSNIQAIKWTDINFDRQVLYIPDTKTGKPQVVPLPKQVQELLREMETFRNPDNPWLFPTTGGSKSGHMENPKKKWNALVVRAGLQDLRMHDLRRTFASYQAITGSSNEIIGKALGDTTPAVISTYARLSQHPVRQSMQRGLDEIMRLATKKQEPKRAENVELF
ncbi:MAG: site-specific integrase [Lachnospiraceae bacterium]|nr:site-specific integrase [Lachnospiraceae bacterium]